MPVQHTNLSLSSLNLFPCRDIEDRALDAAVLAGSGLVCSSALNKGKTTMGDKIALAAGGALLAGEAVKVLGGASNNLYKGFYAAWTRGK